MDRKSDVLLDRLLSGRDELSVTEKERLLEDVLQRAQAPSPPRRGRSGLSYWAWGVAAVALLVLLPTALLLSKENDAFTARGGPSFGPRMELSCSSGSPDVGCPKGSKLFFRLHAELPLRSFSAVALGRDGTAIWYFPGAGQPESASLEALPSSGILEQAIVLGEEHAPGTYAVVGLFAERPLTRDEVRRRVEAEEAAEEGNGERDPRLVRSELKVVDR